MGQKTYTTREAAKQVGVSHQTLHDWIDAGKVAPKQIVAGKMTIRLWTEGDVAKARKIKGTLRPGPRSKKKI
jgi:excisionase family DNA binding protein